MQHFLELHADRVSGSCLDLTAFSSEVQIGH